MADKTKFVEKLNKTLVLISETCGFPFTEGDDFIMTANGKELLRVAKTEIKSPIIDSINKVFEKPSALIDEDSFLPDKIIVNILKGLMNRGSILRLNHLGFCYRALSGKNEIKNIAKEANEGSFFAYQMDSHDASLWLFAGDITDWKEPMIEFLPVAGEIKDKEIDYWLPHIHIDIDTDILYEKLEKLLNEALKGVRIITPIFWNGYPYQARIWLGAISGINIHLDIASISRNTRYGRKVLLTKI